jgi:hypothetical protein
VKRRYTTKLYGAASQKAAIFTVHLHHEVGAISQLKLPYLHTLVTGLLPKDPKQHPLSYSIFLQGLHTTQSLWPGTYQQVSRWGESNGYPSNGWPNSITLSTDVITKWRTAHSTLPGLILTNSECEKIMLHEGNGRALPSRIWCNYPHLCITGMQQQLYGRLCYNAHR